MADFNSAELLEAKDSKKSFEKANDFFKSTRLAFSSLSAEPPAADSFVSDKGLVQFNLIGMKPTDIKYSDIMNENSDNLLAIGGLVHDYMHRQYPTVNTQKLTIESWLNVVDNLPDLAIGKAVDKTFNQRVTGGSISGEFLSMIAKAIITDGASLLTDFNSYLTGIGNLAFSYSGEQKTYNVLNCNYISYLIDNKVGGYYDYGAIVLQQIKFLSEFTQLKSSCSTASSIQVNMEYKEVVSLVQTRRIRQGGPDYDSFKGLINKNSTETFKNAKNFFNAPKTDQKEIKPVVS